MVRINAESLFQNIKLLTRAVWIIRSWCTVRVKFSPVTTASRGRGWFKSESSEYSPPTGKIVLSVGAALRKSFFWPRLVLGFVLICPFSLFVVFTMSLWCPSYVPGLSSTLNIILMLSLPRPFSSRRFQQRLTKEIRKAKHIPQHVLFIDGYWKDLWKPGPSPFRDHF